MFRDILLILFSFLLGAAAASFLFYSFHPEHSFINDVFSLPDQYETIKKNKKQAPTKSDLSQPSTPESIS